MLTQFEIEYKTQLQLLIKRCKEKFTVENMIILLDFLVNTEMVLNHQHFSELRQTVRKKAKEFLDQVDDLPREYFFIDEKQRSQVRFLCNQIIYKVS